VVFRLAPSVREIVGEHPAVHVSRKREKDLPCDAGATGCERESRQCNHGVTAPIAEPVVASDDAATVGLLGKTALDDELIGGEDELPEPGRRFACKSFVFQLIFLEQLHVMIGLLRTSGF